MLSLAQLNPIPLVGAWQTLDEVVVVFFCVLVPPKLSQKPNPH